MNHEKISFIIVLSILFLGCNSNKNLLSSIESKYKNGDIIIINDWVLLQSDMFFNLHKNKFNFSKTDKIEKIQRDSAVSWFGFWGIHHDIYKIAALKFKPTSSDFFIDCKAIKVLNPNDSIFYFINGAPCLTYRNAIRLIQNKRISEISVIPTESAIKIWWIKVGKNGALMINTNK
jgi:hypothetical protein